MRYFAGATEKLQLVQSKRHSTIPIRNSAGFVCLAAYRADLQRQIRVTGISAVLVQQQGAERSEVPPSWTQRLRVAAVAATEAEEKQEMML